MEKGDRRMLRERQQGPKCIIGSVQTRIRIGKSRIIEPVEARKVGATLHGHPSYRTLTVLDSSPLRCTESEI